MSELPDDAIGIYHRMFDFSGVQIPFSTFLLLIIKHLSCMKGWKSGFLLIDQRAIPDYMPWRHSSLVIDDPKLPTGSYNREDVHRLSAHIVKLWDMPEGVLFLSSLSRVWKIRTRDLILKDSNGNGTRGRGRLPFYCTHPIVVDAAIPDPTLEDLAAGTPSAKVMAKAEASKKRKASTSDDDKSDDDDDACVEIPLITPIRYAATIPTGGNQGGALLLPLLKVLAPEAIMSDASDASSRGGDRF
uniref:Uncharacterized protein n=1 Tax=Tanacetum cinerariifolium TaxID=118510 RepID=A0A699I7A9_TANCI|nr:hypothetical protein [Tanacetum cinerariifolium]